VVTVVDDDAPAIVVPEDIMVGTGPGVGFAYVPFSVTVTDECDPDVVVACAAPWGPVLSGDAFPVGSTTVVATAVDHAGNSTSRSFQVTVQDREPPTITAPAAVTLVTDCDGRPLTLTPLLVGAAAADNCDPQPVLAVAPASLDPGSSTVVISATDDDGNVSTRVVAVTVLRGPFTVRFLAPLDANVDNRFQAGRTIPVRIRALCGSDFDAAVVATISRVERIDGAGTPIVSELIDDAGASCDSGASMRLDGDQFEYLLSTANWTTASGARFRVSVRVSKPGHVDTYASVILRNR
jgi:hypothetical protein